MSIMPRRVKQSSSLLAPLAENFLKRLSNTNARLRRKIVRWGLWTIAIVSAYSLMSGTYGIPRIVRLEFEKSNLIEANRKELIDLIDADRIRDMLLHDDGFIEQIARTRYHMVYPGETIYRYHGQ